MSDPTPPPEGPAPRRPQPWGSPQQPPYGPPPQGRPPYGPPPYGPPPYGQQPSPYGHPPYGDPQHRPPQYGPPGYGQPPYGQPPHAPYGQGPPWAPPPEKRSHLPLYGGLALVALLLVLATVLGRTVGPTLLDANAVERDVAGQFEERHGVGIEVRCAEEMHVRAGSEYECTGVTDEDEEITFVIEITDEESPAYTWDLA